MKSTRIASARLIALAMVFVTLASILALSGCAATSLDGESPTTLTSGTDSKREKELSSLRADYAKAATLAAKADESILASLDELKVSNFRSSKASMEESGYVTRIVKPEKFTTAKISLDDSLYITLDFPKEAFEEPVLMYANTEDWWHLDNASAFILEDGGLTRGTTMSIFDIGFKTSSGNDVEPSAPIAMTVALGSVALDSNHEINVYHIDESGEAPTLEVVASTNKDNVTISTTSPDAGTISFKDGIAYATIEANSFSTYAVAYTVDFYYGEYSFHLKGGEAMRLSELFDALSINEPVENVADISFNAPAGLLVFSKAENNEDWVIDSVASFTEWYKLVISMRNGDIYTIDVSDAVTRTLNSMSVGSIVKIPVDGTQVEFIVIQQGNPSATTYGDQCTNGTWVLCKDTYGPAMRFTLENDVTQEKKRTCYDDSNIKDYLENTFYTTLLDESLREEVLAANLPTFYCSNYSGTDGPAPCYSNRVFSNQHVFELGFLELGIPAGLKVMSGKNSCWYETPPNQVNTGSQRAWAYGDKTFQSRLRYFNSNGTNTYITTGIFGKSVHIRDGVWLSAKTFSANAGNTYGNESFDDKTKYGLVANYRGDPSTLLLTSTAFVRPAFILSNDLLVDVDNVVLPRGTTLSPASIESVVVDGGVTLYEQASTRTITINCNPNGVAISGYSIDGGYSFISNSNNTFTTSIDVGGMFTFPIGQFAVKDVSGNISKFDHAVTVNPKLRLSEMEVGDTVKLEFENTLKDFVIIQQGNPSETKYENADGTWVVMKDVYPNSTAQWSSASTTTIYDTSTLQNNLNRTIYSKLDNSIQSRVKSVTIPMISSSVANQKIFALSAVEMGLCYVLRSTSSGVSTTSAPYSFCKTAFTMSQADGVPLEYFKHPEYMMNPSTALSISSTTSTCSWLRTSREDNTTAFCENLDTASNRIKVASYEKATSTSFSARPAMVLDSELYVYSNGQVSDSPNAIGTLEAQTQPTNIATGEGLPAQFNFSVSWVGDTEGRIRYRWYKSASASGTNGQLVYSSSIDISAGKTIYDLGYPFSTLRTDNKYYYYCVASIGENTVQSNAAKLTVYMLDVTSQPTDLTATADRELGASFSCSATWDGPGRLGALRYQWYRTPNADGTNGVPVPTSLTATNSSYSFTATEADDGYYYYCVVSVVDMGVSVKTNVAKLTVLPAYSDYIDTYERLGDLSTGSVVKINIDGEETRFIVIHQGNPSSTYYGSNANGTWLLMEDAYTKKSPMKYSSPASSNNYNNSYEGPATQLSTRTVRNYLNDEFFPLIEPDLQDYVKHITIQSLYMNSQSTSSAQAKYTAYSNTDTKVFILSTTEMGATYQPNGTTYVAPSSPVFGTKLAYFNNGVAGTTLPTVATWTRTPTKYYTSSSSTTYQAYNRDYVWTLNSNGTYSHITYTNTTKYVRPAFVLDSELMVNGDDHVVTEGKNNFVFYKNPDDVTIEGASGQASFSASMYWDGNQNVSVKWYKTQNNFASGGTEVSSDTVTAVANITTYELEYEFPATEEDEGYYYCVAEVDGNTITSDVAKLEFVIPDTPSVPIIVGSPSPITVKSGERGSFAVDVLWDGAPLSYQWYRTQLNNNTSGEAIPETAATNAKYDFEANDTYTGWYYYCVVSVGEVYATSGQAELTVTPVFSGLTVTDTGVTNYKHGETYNGTTSGIKVSATFTDGSNSPVDNADLVFSNTNLTWNAETAANAYSPSKQSIGIAYTVEDGGVRTTKTVSQLVDVARVLRSISSVEGLTTTYDYGSRFTSAGVVVEAVFTDSEALVDISDACTWSLAGQNVYATWANSDADATTTVTVEATLGGDTASKTATLTVRRIPSSLSVVGAKTTYNYGDTFSTEGITVSANYTDGGSLQLNHGDSYASKTYIVREPTLGFGRTNVVIAYQLNGTTVEYTQGITVEDNVKPIIVSVSGERNDWRNSSVTLTITADDSAGSGIVKYIFNGVEQSDNSKIFNETIQAVEVQVKDASGNLSETRICNVFVDTTKPVLSRISGDVVTWTNGRYSESEGIDNRVMLYVEEGNVTETHAGLADAAYRWKYGTSGWGTWTGDSTFYVSGNGTVYCQIKDAAGNTSEEVSIEVNNIDKTPPIIDYSFTPGLPSGDAWTNKVQTLTITASDDGSGLSTEGAFNFNGAGWQTSTSTTVDKSGMILVRVRDTVGNVTMQTISVSNLDTEAPTTKIRYLYMAPDKSSGIVAIIAEDNMTSDEELRYKFGYSNGTSLEEFTDTNQKSLKFGELVTVAVVDLAGNIATRTFEPNAEDAASDLAANGNTSGYERARINLITSAVLDVDGYMFGKNSYTTDQSATRIAYSDDVPNSAEKGYRIYFEAMPMSGGAISGYARLSTGQRFPIYWEKDGVASTDAIQDAGRGFVCITPSMLTQSARNATLTLSVMEYNVEDGTVTSTKLYADSLTAHIGIDVTAPTTAITLNGGKTKVTISVRDSISGVAKFEYYTTEKSLADSVAEDWVKVSDVTNSEAITFTLGSTVKHIKVIATDAIGNVSETYSADLMALRGISEGSGGSGGNSGSMTSGGNNGYYYRTPIFNHWLIGTNKSN